MLLQAKTEVIFANFQYDLYKNIFDLDFLSRCHTNLYHYLNQLFDIKKNCICCFLHEEYRYKLKDWFTGKTWTISLTDCIEHREKIDIDKIRKK